MDDLYVFENEDIDSFGAFKIFSRIFTTLVELLSVFLLGDMKILFMLGLVAHLSFKFLL